LIICLHFLKASLKRLYLNTINLLSAVAWPATVRRVRRASSSRPGPRFSRASCGYRGKRSSPGQSWLCWESDTQLLQPSVYYINVLWAAFACADPKSAKKTAKLSAFFLLLGSSLEKVACKTLMKLTLGVYDSNFFYTQLFR